MSTALERELEEAVLHSWPASECEALDGWLLRSSGGPTHRGNSVSTLGAVGLGAVGLGAVGQSAVGQSAREPELDLQQRLARMEAWYQERGKRAQLQLGPCAAPAGLDAELERRGYQREGEAVVMTAPAARVVERSASVLRTLVEDQAGAAWRGIAAGSSRFASSSEVLEGFLERLAGRYRSVTAWVDGAAPIDGSAGAETTQSTAAAIGLGIRHGRWLGVYAMHTRPELRRRGAARALLHALADHAARQGLEQLYLLVERGNAPARELYGQCGFQELYGYHYRVQPV